MKVKTLELSAGVRYWEDAEINGAPDELGDMIPCRNGECWCPIINVEYGKILNWEQGKKANIHFKVCDDCSWELKDENGEILASVKHEYVPSTLCPKESGYGDYIIMDVDENGVIEGWLFNLDEFIN